MNEKNKDYILNIRISKDTYEKVKREAKENTESVSNLIRKVINDGLGIVSDLTDNQKNITSYHEGKTAKDISCSQCGKIIKSGKIVTVGETNWGKKYYFCSKCK